MKTLPALSSLFAVLCIPVSYALSVADAVSLFDQNVRNYNVVTSGNANLEFINNDTEGPLAIGGNLVVSGVPLVNLGQFNTSADPTLYVGGTFSIAGSGVVQLNNGYASLPGMAGLGTYPYQGDVHQYQPPGATGFLRVNSNSPFAGTDPRTNPGPAGWTFSSAFDGFRAASDTLAQAAANGAISVFNNKLTFSGQSSGVTVFNLDANLLMGNSFNGSAFSSLDLMIASDAVYVINLLNAGGRTIFGTGVNFNLSNDMAGRLLWNIADDGIDVSLGNGGQFYGSVLAPDVNLSNALNAPLKGQIVAGTLTYTNAEIHFADFNPPAPVPEPSTYMFMAGSGTIIGLVVFQRRRAQRASA